MCYRAHPRTLRGDDGRLVPDRRPGHGAPGRGTRRSGRRGRHWTAHTANSSALLDSRPPSPRGARLRRIGLVALLAVSVALVPLAAEVVCSSLRIGVCSRAMRAGLLVTVILVL